VVSSYRLLPPSWTKKRKGKKKTSLALHLSFSSMKRKGKRGRGVLLYFNFTILYVRKKEKGKTSSHLPSSPILFAQQKRKELARLPPAAPTWRTEEGKEEEEKQVAPALLSSSGGWRTATRGEKRKKGGMPLVDLLRKLASSRSFERRVGEANSKRK